MGIVRVLVDGYSLLHHWPELAPGRARHSFHARDALVAALPQYQDSSGPPVPLLVAGGGAPPDTPKNETAKEGIEVLFSKKGQTADQIIERVAHLMKPYGEVLAVTNDYAERETVISLGGSACSCENFLEILDDTMGDMHVGVAQHNKRERKGYRRAD